MMPAWDRPSRIISWCSRAKSPRHTLPNSFQSRRQCPPGGRNRRTARRRSGPVTDGEVSPGFLPAYSPFGGDAAKAAEAAELLRPTPPDLQRLGVIDGIVPEPVGGAHRNWEETAAALRQALRDPLWELKGKTP